MGMRVYRSKSVPERFWEKVDRSGGPDACWPWIAFRRSTGHGQFMLREGVATKAHRVAYEFANGPIPEGAWVLHSCHLPFCCNPRHLRLGTPADNVRDTVGSGRYWRGPNWIPQQHKPQSHPRPTAEERFWAKVDRQGFEECWRWLGAISTSGYGSFWDGTRYISAHKYAAESVLGTKPAGAVTIHSCDVQLCCNPRHLRYGSYMENSHDMMEKGRQQDYRKRRNNAQRGDMHWKRRRAKQLSAVCST